MRGRQNVLWGAAGLMGMGLLVTGCGGDDRMIDETKKSTTQMVQDRIKEIQNNPNMPQQAKDSAIAAMRNSNPGTPTAAR